MASRDATSETGYSWAYLRNWAIDFVIEYLSQGRAAAKQMGRSLDQERLNIGDWDARDAIQFLIDVIDESVDSVLSQKYERQYFEECAPLFAQDMTPKSIVVECSRILGRMEESTERRPLPSN